MTTKTSLGSIIESSVVAIVIVSSVLPGLKFRPGSGSALKSASLALANKTVALNKMRKYSTRSNMVHYNKIHFVREVKFKKKEIYNRISQTEQLTPYILCK